MDKDSSVGHEVGQKVLRKRSLWRRKKKRNKTNVLKMIMQQQWSDLGTGDRFVGLGSKISQQ